MRRMNAWRLGNWRAALLRSMGSGCDYQAMAPASS